ncbi:MAG: hypothetical protein ACC660_05390, partial [Acidimicrobiales bacterium]
MNQMRHREKFEVAVIGGGIAIAAHVSDDSDVVLFEKETQPGVHTTGRSAATFIDSYGTPTIRRLTLASRPGIRTDWVAGGVLDPDAADIDVHGLHQHYLARVRAKGGQIRLNSETLSLRRVHGG